MPHEPAITSTSGRRNVVARLNCSVAVIEPLS
jgi:hypothetical protein